MPPAGKKTFKSKLAQDCDPSKDPPIQKKTGKRQKSDTIEEDDDDIFMSKVIGQYQASVKKMKIDPDAEAAATRKKILDLFGQQHQSRRQYNDTIFKQLSEITSQVEADYSIMKENEQKMEQLAGCFMKCVRQATVACKQKLKALSEIENFYRKQFDELESEQKVEIEKLMEKLDNDIKKLEDKFYRESKRKSWECVRRNIFHAMQNDDY